MTPAEPRADVSEIADELRACASLTDTRVYTLLDRLLDAFDLGRKRGLHVPLWVTREAGSSNLQHFAAVALDRLARAPNRTRIRSVEKRLLALALCLQWEDGVRRYGLETYRG
jgi:hypothetical protein